MKCGVNAIPGWQLELVGNLVDLPTGIQYARR